MICTRTIFRCARRWIFLVWLLVLIFLTWTGFLDNDVIIPTSKTSPSVWSTCCRTKNANGLDVCRTRNCTGPCPSRSEFPFGMKDDDVFFLETSGSGSLNIRQACTVESLARLNPKVVVRVLLVDADVDEGSSMVQLLKKEYPNVHPIRIDSDELVAGTPLDRWYFCSSWRDGPYSVVHLSDGLRLLLISLYGGYYFDLDIVFVKPITKLKNFVVAQSPYSLANGIFHFDQSHPYVHETLQEFVDGYQSSSWDHNGPELLNRVLASWCDIKYNMSIDPAFEELTDSVKMKWTCGHEKNKNRPVMVLHPKTFFPIFFDKWKKYFDEPADDYVFDERFIGAHVWNGLSSKQPVSKFSNNLYSLLARSYCPKVYSLAPDPF